MTWLLANPRLIGYIAAFLAIFSAGAYVNGLRWEHKLAGALKDQQEVLVKQCNDNIKITEGASDEYQKKLAAANSKLATYRRMYSGSTVPVTGKANGFNAGPAGAVNAGKAGIAAITLLEYGAECEQYRSQVIGLQGFINRVWQR